MDVRTAAQRVKVLGADLEHPSPIVPIRAPISGTIVEQNITGGTGVRSLDNSPNLFTIADLSRVWILCDVYENMLSRVHVGDFAEVRLLAYPDRPLRARVGNISRVLDPNTRAAKVRLEFDNPGRIIRSGMFATAVFRSQQEQLRVVVPAMPSADARQRLGVSAPKAATSFGGLRSSPVLPDGMRQVTSGLAAGDKVVINALQFAGTVEEQ